MIYCKLQWAEAVDVYTTSGALASGSPVVLDDGTTAITYQAATASGDKVGVYRSGRFYCPKYATGYAISAGDLCYWNDTAKKVKADGTILLGIAADAAGASADGVYIYLNCLPFPQASNTDSGAGDAYGTEVAASEYGDGIYHKTVLTITALDIAQGDNGSTASGGVKIYDMPAGAIKILGATCNLVLSTNMGETNDTLVAGIGTTTAGANGTLTSTEQDIIPSTDLAAMVAGVGAFKAQSTATEEVTKDGTGTAIDVFLNFADSADNGGTGKKVTVTSGTVTLHWINLGDY